MMAFGQMFSIIFKNRFLSGTLAAGGMLLGTQGCGSADREQHHISGTVTFDGQAVPAGFISFIPDVSAGNDGTQGYTEIKNGNFDTARTGKGVTGGPYVMRVRGFVPPHGATPGKMLFQNFEQNIDLPAATSRHDIVVPSSARSTADLTFDPT